MTTNPESPAGAPAPSAQEAPQDEVAPPSSVDGGVGRGVIRVQVPNRPNTSTVGTLVWLIVQLMFLTGLFGIYYTARSVTPGAWPPAEVDLNVWLASGLCVIAIASSAACARAATAASGADRDGIKRWFLVTVALGVVFLVGQIIQVLLLLADGLTLDSSAFSAAFYLLVLFQAVLVVGDMAALVWFVRTVDRHPFTPRHSVKALVLTYCWHFSVIAWIAIFVAVYLIR